MEEVNCLTNSAIHVQFKAWAFFHGRKFPENNVSQSSVDNMGVGTEGYLIVSEWDNTMQHRP